MSALLIIIILILLFMAGLLFPLLWIALPIVIVLCVIAGICSGVGSLFGESKEDETKRLEARNAETIARGKQADKEYREWLRGKNPWSEDEL